MLKTPLKKIDRNRKTVFFFLALLLIGLVITTLFILPVIDNPILTIIYALIYVGILINFLLSFIITPGYIKPHSGFDFQTLLNTLDPVFLCPDCQVIRTPRSRHCNMWNMCVERYDHHCPYINNWVGYRNHLFFTLFLFFVLCLLIFQVAITGYAFKFLGYDRWWGFLKHVRPRIVFYITAAIIFILCGLLFLVPVSLLFITHVVNFFTFQTTHERFAPHRAEEENLESTSKASKSSIFESFMKSDILIQTNQEINAIPNKPYQRRTSNDSVIKFCDKREDVQEGNYISDMEYHNIGRNGANTANGAKSARKCSIRNLCRMIMYKAPSQRMAKSIVERHMRKELERQRDDRNWD